MKTFILTALAMLNLAAASAVFARLGETEAEIVARYGEGKKETPRFPNTTQMKYSKNGFEIFVHFLAGKSVMEQFKNSAGEKWSDEAVVKFIKTLSSGDSWTYSRREKIWYRDKKTVVARREPGHDDWLWIENRVVMKQFDQDKTKGF